MKEVLMRKRSNMLFVNKLLSKNYFELDKEENWYEKRIERVELKLNKLKIEEEISKNLENEEKLILLKKEKNILKKKIKALDKVLFKKKEKRKLIINKKFIVITNNKGFSAFTFDKKNSILNKNNSKRNVEFWLSNLPKGLCKKAYYNYFLENGEGDLSNLSECINFAENEINTHTEDYFRNTLVEDYDLAFDYKLIDFLDYNFFNEKDTMDMLKLIVSNKAIGNLTEKDISLKCYTPSKYMLNILTPILDRKIDFLYELRFKDLKILLAEVNKI